MGVEHGFVKKAGAWFTYTDGQLGQGKENARRFLKENPEVAAGIEKLIKEKLGIGPKLVDDPQDAAKPTDAVAADIAAGEDVAKPVKAPARARKTAAAASTDE
jgi:recombination protein RecA